MKKFRIMIVALLIIAFAAMLTGCYVVSGQKMNKLKGTYKLTSYTYTPSYSDKNGYVPATRDYINDERYKYEDYLVITGESMGYYVHKEANAPAYVKEVTLSYEHNAEDSSKIDYVTYKDALAKNQTPDGSHLGVSGKTLNFSAPSIHIGSQHTRDCYVRWEKVDNATDLSYAKQQLGELKEYDFDGFAARGIYELGSLTDVTTGEVKDNGYQYFYYVIDTAKGVTTATVCYALRDTPTEQVKKTVPFVHEGTDWSAMTIDGVRWAIDPSWGTYYFSERDGLKYQLTCVSYDLSEDTLNDFVSSRLPEITE